MCVGERECVCVRGRERVCVRERERECVCMCVCVCCACVHACMLWKGKVSGGSVSVQEKHFDS